MNTARRQAKTKNSPNRYKRNCKKNKTAEQIADELEESLEHIQELIARIAVSEFQSVFKSFCSGIFCKKFQIFVFYLCKRPNRIIQVNM